jgi:CheY-like chemotaxis protein
MKKKILVVDDEADIQNVIQILLDTDDYDVTSAENGRVALEMLESGPRPDILLLDLMMPHMSGYYLLNEFYRRGLHTTFSIVVMSADVLTKHQIDSLGIKAFVSKPFDINELQRLIESL